MHKKLREVAEGRGEGKVAFLKTEGQKLGDGKKKNRADQEKDDGINIEIIAPDMIIPKKP
jgi:hypothetical protein